MRQLANFRLTIQQKLFLGFGTVLLLMFMVCLYLLLEMKSMNTDYSSLIHRKAYSYAMTESALAQYNKAAIALKSHSEDGGSVSLEQFKQAVNQGDTNLNKVVPLLETKEENQLYDEFRSKCTEFIEMGHKVTYLVQNREGSTGAGREAIAKELSDYLESHKGIIEELTTSGETFAKHQEQRLAQGNNQLTASVANTLRVSVFLAALTLVLGLLIAYFVARLIEKPIRLLDVEAAKIAAGDLTGNEIKTTSKDELGRLTESFNSMVGNLKEIAGQLQRKSQDVALSANTLSAGAENVSQGASQTSANIAEVAATVDQVAANAKNIAGTSSETASLAWAGEEGIRNVRSQMTVIENSASANVEIIQGLSKAAGQISSIVDLINRVAEQTNLLALNAAIEAARAGEHGRGFAVVAEEVRKLADQSTGATKEIYTLIKAVQQEAQRAAASMEQSAAEVQVGTKVMQEVEESFSQIITSVQGLVGEIQTIAASAQEITLAVQNVAAAAEQQTATMEEVSGVSQNLAELAVELESLAGKFKLSNVSVPMDEDAPTTSEGGDRNE